MRSKSLSRSRISTPGWSRASHPSSFNVYAWRRAWVARACRSRSLTSPASVLPCRAALALSVFRRSPSSVRVVLFMHQDVVHSHQDVKAKRYSGLRCRRGGGGGTIHLKKRKLTAFSSALFVLPPLPWPDRLA